MSEAKSAWVLDVTEESFEREVLERSRATPVVVDFWAPWCGPCRMLGPILEKLAEEKGGEFLLAKVNVDEAQELAAAFQIESIPAVKAFRDGRPDLQFEGLLPERQLREFIDRICPTEADHLVRQAAAQESDKPAEAEASYRRALALESTHPAAVLGLARVLIAQKQDGEADELLSRHDLLGEHGGEAERLRGMLFLRQQGRVFGEEATLRRRLDEQPADSEVRYALGCVVAAAGRYAEALELLLTAAAADRKRAAGQVREAMVKIFQIIGVRSDLADEYRDKLSRLLY